MDSIAKTSLLTAALRAAETNRPEKDGRLFTDTYAELLAGEEGASFLRAALTEVGEQPAIAIRTAFMDSKIIHSISNGVQQIVILAAGMDTRSYRLNLSENIHVFELDRDQVFTYKNQKIQNVKPTCKLTQIGADLSTDWKEKLLKSKFDSNKKTLWLVEGLLMYLEPSVVFNFFRKLSSLAKKNDILLADILSKTLLESPYMKKQLDFLEKMGAKWRFGVDEPEQYLKEFGWSAKALQTGEFAPNRWPMAIAPRSIPNLPRGFLVEALKS